MKRKAALFLSMILVLSTIFTGCGGKGDPDSEVKENMSDVEQSTETRQEAGNRRKCTKFRYNFAGTCNNTVCMVGITGKK